MNRKYNLKLDLQFRCNNSIMKFNQFDNNTSDFFIKISNGGKSFDVEKAIVVLAIIKPSGKVASQFVEIENGLVYADLKPSMKDEIGTYTAKAMLILEDERVVTESISYEVEEDKIFSLLNDTVEDTEDFTLLTDMLSRLSTIEISEEQRVINEAERILSEENRKTEEAERVEAELVRQHEEADRTKYDAIRESNENIRKINEEARISSENVRLENEANRIEQEANRAKAEQLRKDNYNFMTEDEERRRLEANAHKEAEVLRVQAETNRVNEEAKRRTTEQARVSAENTRVSNENTRKANETTRQNNETHRVEAETKRQNRYNSFIADAEANASNFENYTNSAKVKEEERKSNELNRKSQEDRRVSNEVERISNENTRKANEEARIESEKQRADAENLREEKIIEIQSDYDSLKKVIIDENASANLQNQINQTNSQLEHKANDIDVRKRTESITMSDLHTDVKQAMTGGSVAVVGIDSVGSENIKEASVGVRNLNFSPIVGSKLGKNLFDKTSIKLNSSLNTSNGSFITNDSYFCSDFIRVDAGTTYVANVVNQCIYYDINKSFISTAVNAFPERESTFTIPDGVSYIVICTKNQYLNTLQIEVGTKSSIYEDYGFYLGDKTINKNMINFDLFEGDSNSKNLFDKNNVVEDKYISWTNGREVTSTSYVCSNYIAIDESETYTINYFDQIAFYNSNKSYIGGVDGYQLESKTITTPVKCDYIRVSVRKTKLNEYQLEKGSTSTSYEDYYKNKISKSQLDRELQCEINSKGKEYIQDIMLDLVFSENKIKIKLLGDSITAGQGGTGYDQLGDLIYDAGWKQWYVNANGVCWANSLKAYLESKFNCEVLNYGMAGIFASNLVDAYDSIIKDDDDIIILMVGTNNRNYTNLYESTTKRLYDDLKKVVTRLEDDGKRVILMSNIPASVKNEKGSNILFHMEDVDNVIAKLSKDLNKEYISLFKLFNCYCDAKNITIDSLLVDGLHPNDNGYGVMFELICNNLGIATKTKGADW